MPMCLLYNNSITIVTYTIVMLIQYVPILIIDANEQIGTVGP